MMDGKNQNASTEKLNISAFTVDVEDGVSIAMRDAFSKKTEQTDRVVHLPGKFLTCYQKIA